LAETAKNINALLLQKGEEDPEYRYCGTTVTGFLAKETEYYLLNVGDSRVYKYNGFQHLKRLTKDHSFVQDLLDKRMLTEEEAFNHPRRNMVTSSLGIEEKYLRISVSGPHPLEPKDVLLAFSDGVHDALTDEQLLSVLQTRTTDLAHTIAEAALDAGGSDNITVCLLRINETYHPKNEAASPA
jgi:PPM family protein phosphatase